MYFYLKEPNGDKDTIIIIQYYIKDEKKLFKYSTGEVINPNDWDFTARMPKVRKGTEGVRLRKITSYIMQYHDFLLTLIDNYKLNGEKISREMLKLEFDKHFKPEKIPQEFEYLTDFVDDFLKGIKGTINKNTGREYSPSTIRGYIGVCNILKEFERYIKKRVMIVDYNKKMNDIFIDFCIHKRKEGLNSIRIYIQVVKVFLKKAKEKGCHISDDLSDFTVTQSNS